MRSYWQIFLIFVLPVLADGAAAQAQSQVDGRFNRVSTPGVRRTSAGTLPSVRSVARSGGTAAVGGGIAITDSLLPYSSHAQARLQGQTDGTPQSSTWREESRPAVAPQVNTQSAPHNYYPGLRPSLAIQQPVTLTARATGVPHICTPSRSMMVGGGHHGR
jgi:hypothetical protein